MHRPKFSIIIPTRQRHDTLHYSIKTVLAQSYADFEVVIMDNRSSRETEVVAKSFRDSRIKYFRSEKRLSMTQNWEAALSHAAGNYINILGDDDGLMPNALLKASQIFEEQAIDIVSWFRWPYFWPTATSPSQRNSLYITLAERLERVSSRASLIAFYQNTLGFEYMPMLYNSFVECSVIDRIRKSHADHYFSDFCFSPDIYSGIVNAYFSHEYIFSNTPLSLSGISGHSNGFAIANPQHGSEPADKFFAEHKDAHSKMLHPAMPKINHPGVLLLSDQMRTKEQFFPEDEELIPNAFNLLCMMAAGLDNDKQHYSYHYAAITAIAESVGIDPAEVGLNLRKLDESHSGLAPQTPQSKFEGWLGDPKHATNAIVDCSRLNISNVHHACTLFSGLLDGSLSCSRDTRQIVGIDAKELQRKCEGSNPLVSIAIPTHNRSKLLEKAIHSALSQDYANTEIIIFDNASTDETEIICLQLADQHPNLQYYRHPYNCGAVENFKAALAASTGHYFMWLGDDDWIDPNYVSACVGALRNNPQCVLAYGQPEYLLEDGTYLYSGKGFDLAGSSPAERVQTYYRSVTDNGLFYGVIRRDRIIQIPFATGMGADWIMMAALSYVGQVRFCDATKIYRLHKALKNSGDIDNAYIEGAKRDGLPKLHGHYPHLAIAIGAYNDILYSSVYQTLHIEERKALAKEVAQIISDRHQSRVSDCTFQILATLEQARRQVTSKSLWEEYYKLRSLTNDLSQEREIDCLIALACDQEVKNDDPLPIHFFTLVLNGHPFIEHHIRVLETLPFEWHWHIVEGVADLKNDTAWSLGNGAYIPETMHRDGVSIDGTTEYIDLLKERYPKRISVYRKQRGQFWDGKLEMVRAPLENINQECLLWQIDCDEYWTTHQLCAARQLFLDDPDKTAAFYWCWFFVGPRLVISTRNCYAQNPSQEWLRTWRYKPGMQWITHEPPILGVQASDNQWIDSAKIDCFTHEVTAKHGLVFQHFAYVLDSQLIFKESYYGYKGALEGWKRLQNCQQFPVRLRDYFNWVRDLTEVDRCSSFDIQPLLNLDCQLSESNQFSQVMSARSSLIASTDFKEIVVDAVFFQRYRTGIARLWQSLLESWSGTEFADHIVVLDRANTAPRVPGIRYIDTPAYDYSYSSTDNDRRLLQEICNQEGADLFISTYYTTPISTPSVFMAYDMIPEIMGYDPQDGMWQEKAHAANHASGYICISQNTAKDLIRFYPEAINRPLQVAHCGIAPHFYPSPSDEVAAFQARVGITKPYFMLAGVRGGYKNAGLFFKAFAQLPNKADFEILCTGVSLTLEEDWQPYVKGIKVHMLYLNDDELRNAYAGATALVFPSQYEGFGLPVLEAMSCGCPVITCPNSSLPEVGGKAVLYVNDQDVTGMTLALHKIQDATLRQILIERGIEQSQRFSWSDMASRVSSFLLEVAESQQSIQVQSAERARQGQANLHGMASVGQTPQALVDLLTNPLSSSYMNWLLNRLAGILRAHSLDPEDQPTLALLRELRQQMAEFWLVAPDHALAQIYPAVAEKGYRALLNSGIQGTSLTPPEQTLLNSLTRNITQGLDHPLGLKSLLGAMLYYPPGKMQVQNAAERLPAWLLRDYQAVFESPDALAAIAQRQPHTPNSAPAIAPSNLAEDMVFLNRMLGCANLYYIDPDEQSIVEELRQIRRQVAEFWLSVPGDRVEAVFQSEFGKRYRSLLQCGFQNEPLKEDETAFVQTLSQRVAAGIEQPDGLKAFLGVMLYYPPGKMQVRDAATRLPSWLWPDYQAVFEVNRPEPLVPGTLPQGAIAQGAPPPSVPDPTVPPAIAPPHANALEKLEDMVFLNRLLGLTNLYEIDPTDTAIAAELREMRSQVTQLWLSIPDDRLEAAFNSEFGRRYGSYLRCGFQREALTPEETQTLQRLAQQVATGLEQPAGLKAFLGAMMYYPPGKMKVSNADQRLPGWLLPTYRAVFEEGAAIAVPST